MSPLRLVRRMLALAGRFVTILFVAGAACAEAAGTEQRRYADETLALHHPEYVARASDFRAARCEPPWSRPRTGVTCRAPAPYDSFDWSTDGCTWTPPPARNVFDGPCQLHDFGYRNFGRGLTLGRSENMRKAIDVRFREEMYRACRDPSASALLGGYTYCVVVAYGMYAVVRRRGDWSKPCPAGRCHPSTAPAAPAPRPGPTPRSSTG